MSMMRRQIEPILATFKTDEEKREYVARTRMELLLSGLIDDVINPVMTDANKRFIYWDGLLTALNKQIGNTHPGMSGVAGIYAPGQKPGTGTGTGTGTGGTTEPVPTPPPPPSTTTGGSF